MREIKNGVCLSEELKRLAKAEKTADFNFAPDIAGLPDGERETALLIKQILDNYKTALEYDLMKYKLTGTSLNVGYWDIAVTEEDPASPDNKLTWSPELRRMLGYSGEEDFVDTTAVWLDHLHPGDRSRALGEFTAHLRDRTGATRFVTEYRLRKKDGGYIFVRAFGTALRNGTGMPTRVAGAVEDITEAKRTRETLHRREKTLDILNKAAITFLSREEKNFEGTMTDGLNLIAGIADIDRMSVFRNSVEPDGLCMSQIYRWRKDANGIVKPWLELKNLPYTAISSRYERTLAAGKHIAGLVRLMPERDFFQRFDCVNILAIPVFDGGKFWGFTFFERLTEKKYTEQETEVLRSASFMLANAVIRDAESAMIRQANKQSRLMLDTAPFSVTMWDRNYRVIDCSMNAVDVFGFSDKRDLVENLLKYAPEYQPCGGKSMDILAEAAAKAYKTGSCRLEWTHFTTDGDPIVFDATAVRVKYNDDYALMLYSRDIREEKKMLAEIDERGRMLVSQAETISLAKEQVQQILDAIPVSITIWDRNFNVLDCSQYAVDLFGFATKRELLERLADYVPEYQPCGKKSTELLAEESARAFSTGYSRVEWTQLTTRGEPVLLDAKAIRIKHGGDYVLMLFSRDIRKEKKMLAEIHKHDEMLAAQTHWYKSLLDSVPLPISVTDTDMNITFTNISSAALFGQDRDSLIGRPCRIWDVPICGTDGCSIACMKRGVKHTSFKADGRSYKVSSDIIRDLTGETVGYIEILNDVTEIESKAKWEADAANKAKSAFLAQMSHEMRTPLSAVIGLSELVLENGGLSKDNEVYLDKIYNAGSTLLSIVNDILDISKIEAGKFEVFPQEYDVPSLINDAVTQNILRIHSKPVRFTLDVNENVPARLRGDDVRVKQIISNLLSNAFKYTDNGAVELRIGYERDGDSVWTTFRVSDTGIGIRPDDLKRLFTDYTRFDEATNRKTNGTGLGLSITKRLVELMGGVITAESEYGKGSVFTAKIRQQFVNDAVIGSEMADHLRNFLYTTSKRRSGAQLNRVHIPYARVLVVDDNRTNLDIALGLMRPYGMEIDCVTSGQAAIDAIRAEDGKYSAVFMDHMMPGMDGVEAVRIIRKEIGSDYAKTVPIIALTANAVAGNRERFIRRGFNAFVSKPIDIFRLDTVIRRWIWDMNKERRTDPPRAAGKSGAAQDRRKAGDSALRRLLEEIGGLDWNKGLGLFGGEQSFLHVLRSFAVNTKPLLDLLSGVSEDSLPGYAITVHGVKSSARGVCADAIGALAESLEFAAKDGDFGFVRRHNPDFLKAVRKLIAEIESLLNKTENIRAKPEKSKPDESELKALYEACANYDMDGMEAVMEKIDRFAYTDDDGFVDWLRDGIARLNYAQVSEKIAQVIKPE